MKGDPEFHYVMEDMERLRHKIDENRISLNEDARKKELADDKLRKETRSKERLARNQEEPSIYRVTLDTVDKPNLQLIMYRRGRIANELLQEHLSEHPIEPGPQLVSRRYERLAKNVHEQDKDEQVKLYLDALAQAYDPHSEYLSKADLKNFSINMGLSLVGIGAMLRSEDGYAKIESLVPGGPAQTDGRLKVGDRISAVAQGPAEFVDVREMRLDKVVEMIRGKKGTRVRLLVIPSDAADPSRRKNVELVRDEIKLKDQEARADIIIEERRERRSDKTRVVDPAFFLCRHGQAPEEHDARCARVAQAAEEREHRRSRCRSA